MAIRYKTRFARFFAVVVAFFGTAKVALSFTEVRTPGLLRDLMISDFLMPKALGFITSRHPIITSPKTPIGISQESF